MPWCPFHWHKYYQTPLRDFQVLSELQIVVSDHLPALRHCVQAVTMHCLVAIDGSKHGNDALLWAARHLWKEGVQLDVVTGVHWFSHQPVSRSCSCVTDFTHIKVRTTFISFARTRPHTRFFCCIWRGNNPGAANLLLDMLPALTHLPQCCRQSR